MKAKSSDFIYAKTRRFDGKVFQFFGTADKHGRVALMKHWQELGYKVRTIYRPATKLFLLYVRKH